MVDSKSALDLLGTYIECISIFFIVLIESVDSPDRAAKVSLRVQKRLKTRLFIEGWSNLRPNMIVILMHGTGYTCAGSTRNTPN